MVRKSIFLIGAFVLLIFGISIAAADESSVSQTPLPEYSVSVVGAPVEFITYEDGSTAQLIVIEQTFAISGNVYTEDDGDLVSQEIIVKSSSFSSLSNEGNVRALIYWIRLFGAKHELKFLDSVSDEELKRIIQGKIAGSGTEISVSSAEFGEPTSDSVPIWGDGYSIIMGKNDNGEPRPVVRISDVSKVQGEASDIVDISQIYSGISYSGLEYKFFVYNLGNSIERISEDELSRQTIWSGSEEGGSWNTFSVTASLEEKQKADMELSEEILRRSSVLLN